MFSATVMTGMSMKCWCTMPSPESIASLAELKLTDLPRDEDLARVGLVEPVQDVHQRRLPGAVLTEERVHLAAREIEADVVVGEHARELLDDPAHLEDGGRSHRPRDSMALASGEKYKGRALARPLAGHSGVVYLINTGGVYLPSMIRCLSASVLARIAFGTCGLVLPRPMPVVGEVEGEVARAERRAGLDRLDELEDALVDALDAARQHVARERVLVDVDADAPDVRLVGGLERAEAAETGDLEEQPSPPARSGSRRRPCTCPTRRSPASSR